LLAQCLQQRFSIDANRPYTVQSDVQTIGNRSDRRRWEEQTAANNIAFRHEAQQGTRGETLR
jgi:hypothetical protein